MGLQARQWGRNPRINLAATTPFQSMHTGQYGDSDTGEPVQILSQTLKYIELHSYLLPPRLLPHQYGPQSPPGIQWGPFEISTEAESFSELLRLAVMKFQKQAGDLDVDGKAGMNTFRRLDELMVYLENVPS